MTIKTHCQTYSLARGIMLSTGLLLATLTLAESTNVLPTNALPTNALPTNSSSSIDTSLALNTKPTANTLSSVPAAHKPLVIAHRGASGYLPEHSMEAKVLAFAQGADFIEQDLVMTKDNQVIVQHDYTLERVTNIAQTFPQRARADGRYYAIDFTLAELRTLNLSNGYSVQTNGQRKPEWSERFSVLRSHFSIHTFAEEIELIQELNRLFNKNVGIYPEIKSPWFHHQQGKDISRYVLEILKQYGYTNMRSRVFLQCFDPNELIRIDKILLPEYKMDIPLVQLMANTSWGETYEKNEAGKWVPYDYQWMFEAGAMAKIRDYAEAIGPYKPFIITSSSDNARGYQITPLVQQAKAQGLLIHPYTFRADKNRLTPWASSFEDMVRVFVNEANIDGLFTDFPDRARAALLTR